jgi:hypothetical protein
MSANLGCEPVEALRDQDAVRAPAVGGDHRAAGRHSVVTDGGR